MLMGVNISLPRILCPDGPQRDPGTCTLKWLGEVKKSFNTINESLLRVLVGKISCNGLVIQSATCLWIFLVQITIHIMLHT